MDRRATIPLRTGASMPALGLGTWELTHETAATVCYAVEQGYRMIDTAVDYGSQSGIGDALRDVDVPRAEIFLVAKVEEDDDGYDAIRRYLDEMRQDYADLVLIHRPPPKGLGVRIWDGLVRARAEGYAREIGVSNYSIHELRQLEKQVGEAPLVNQIEWTPFGWSADMLRYCRERGIVIQAYSPLTRGERLYDDGLRRVAERVGGTPAQVLLAWAIGKGVAPLPKANQREHLRENLGALGIGLAPGDVEELDRMNEGYSALGPALQYVEHG